MARNHAPAHRAATPGLIDRYLPWISGGALVGVAAVSFPGRDYLLTGLMLFLPLADHSWRLPALPQNTTHFLPVAGLLLVVTAIITWQPTYLEYFLNTLFITALPEEWFFRAYFMESLGAVGFHANIASSILFSLLHGLSRDWPTAFLVFLPSLFYGWLYQRSRNLPLLIFAHALSNLIFAVFLSPHMTTWMGHLR